MSTRYVYIPFKTTLGCATVGFYNPEGGWIPESDHANNEAAAQRVNYLNGGQTDSALRTALLEICNGWKERNRIYERAAFCATNVHDKRRRQALASEVQDMRLELEQALKLPA